MRFKKNIFFAEESQSLQDNLRNWMNNITPLEWVKLEAQDPSGKLKRLNFERFVKRILL